MKKHICKQCHKTFEYCRGCLLSPISYKEMGFCSVACLEAFKNIKEVILTEDVEVVITDRDTSTSE